MDQRVGRIVQDQTVGRVPLVDITGDILDLTVSIGIGEYGRDVLLRNLEIEYRRYDNQVGAGNHEYHPTTGCLYISTEPWEPPAPRPAGVISDEPLGQEADAQAEPQLDWSRLNLEVVNLAGDEAFEPDEEILNELFGELNGHAANPDQRQYWCARLWANYGRTADALKRCLNFTRHQVQDSDISPWDRVPRNVNAKLHVIIAGDLSDPLTSAVIVDVYTIACRVLNWPAISFTFLAFLDPDVIPQRALNAYLALFEMQEFARLEETPREQVAAWLEWQEATRVAPAEPDGNAAADETDAATATNPHAVSAGSAGARRVSQPRRNLPSDNYSRRAGTTEIGFPRDGALPFSRILLYSRRPATEQQARARHGRDDPVELGAELAFHLIYSRLLQHIPQIQARALWEFGFINVGFLKVEIPIDTMLRHFIARHGADCFGLALEPLEDEREFEARLAEQQHSSELARRTSPGNVPETPVIDRVLTEISTDFQNYFPPSEFLNWVRSGFREWCRDWVYGSPEDFLSHSARGHDLGGFERQARSRLQHAYHMSSGNIFGGPRHQTLVELSAQLRAAAAPDSPLPGTEATIPEALPDTGAGTPDAAAEVDTAAIRAAMADAQLAADDAVRGPTGQAWGRGQQGVASTALRNFLNNQLLHPMRRALTEPYTKFFRAQQFHQWLSERFADNSPELGPLYLQISDQVTALLQEYAARAQAECASREEEVMRVGSPRIAGWQASVLAVLSGVGAYYLGKWLIQLPELLRWTANINPAWSILLGILVFLIVRSLLLWSFRPDSSNLQLVMSDWVRAVGRARMLGQYANQARQLYPQAFTAAMRTELEEYQGRLETMHSAFSACRNSFLNIVRETARDYHDIADRFTMVIDFSEAGTDEQTAPRPLQFDFLDEQVLADLLQRQQPESTPDQAARWVHEHLAGFLNNPHVDSRYLRGIITGEHALDGGQAMLDDALDELRNYYKDDEGNPASIVDHILLDDGRMAGLFRRSLMRFLTPENFMHGGELLLFESNPDSELERLLRRFIPNAAEAFAGQCQQLRLIDAMARHYAGQPMRIAEEIADYSQELVNIQPDAFELQQNPPAAPLAFILLPSEQPIAQRLIRGYATTPVNEKAAFSAELLAHSLVKNLKAEFSLEPSSIHFERCQSSYLMLLLRMSYCRGFNGLRALADLRDRMTSQTGALDYLGSECHPAIHYHWTGQGLPLPGYEDFYDLEGLFSQLHNQVQEHRRLVRAAVSAESYARYRPSESMVTWARQAIEGAETPTEQAQALFSRFIELHRFDPDDLQLPAGIEANHISATGLVYTFILYAQAVGLAVYYYTVELATGNHVEPYGCAGLELETDRSHEPRIVFIDVIRETFDRADFQRLRRRRYNQREMAELFDGWIRQRLAQQRVRSRQQPAPENGPDGSAGPRLPAQTPDSGPVLPAAPLTGAAPPIPPAPASAGRPPGEAAAATPTPEALQPEAANAEAREETLEQPHVPPPTVVQPALPADPEADGGAPQAGPNETVPATTNISSTPPPTDDDPPDGSAQPPPAPASGQPGDA